MKLYLILIAIFNAIIDLLVIFLLKPAYEWYVIVGITAGDTLIVFIIDLLLAIIVNKFPEKWFEPKKKIFRIFNWEKSFYEHIGVKHFKDHVPELGKFKGFEKNTIQDPNNPEYIHKYMVECCYGEVVHILGIIIGFVTIFCCPFDLWLFISLPVSVINAFMCALPHFTLRYNRKKLEKLYEALEKRNKRKKA